MFKTRKQKCAVVLAVSALAAAITVAGYFIAESLKSSSADEVAINLYIFEQKYFIYCNISVNKDLNF